MSSARAPHSTPLQLGEAVTWARAASSHYKRLADSAEATSKETEDAKLKQMLTEYQSNAKDTVKLMKSLAEAITAVDSNSVEARSKDIAKVKSKETNVLRDIAKHCSGRVSELASTPPSRSRPTSE